jgi:hypothetical protein
VLENDLSKIPQIMRYSNQGGSISDKGLVTSADVGSSTLLGL